MPEYLSPGVYVEEIDAGPKPIEGVSTSTCGAVGVTERGPTTGKPELVTSFLEFQRKFGGFLPEPQGGLFTQWALDDVEGGRWWQFPLSVKGFFDNGGQRLYVKRVFPSTGPEPNRAQFARVVLGTGNIAEITRDAAAGSTQLRLRHTIGIDNGTTVRVFVNGLPVSDHVVSSYTAAGVVTVAPAIIPEVEANRDFVHIFPSPPPAPVIPAMGPVPRAVPAANVRLTVRAKARGSWGGDEDPANINGITAGNGLRVRARGMVGAAFRLLGSPTAGGVAANTTVAVAAPAASTNIEVVSATGFAVNNRAMIDGAEYLITGIATTGSFDLPAGGAVNPIAAGTPIMEGPNVRGNVVTALAVGDTTVQTTNITGLANNDTVNIGPDTYNPITNVTPDNPVFTINPAVPAGNTWAAGTTVRRLRTVIDPASPDVVNVQNASQLYAGALVELDTSTDKELFTVDSITGDAVTLSGNPANTYFEDYRLRLIEGEISVQYRRENIVVEEETFSNLRFLDDGGPNYIVRQINEESKLIDLEAGADFSGSVGGLDELPIIPVAASGPQGFWGDLTGGRDNLQNLSPDDFVGVEGGSLDSTGVQSLEYIDEISIALAPGIWSQSVRAAMTSHCETLKDRFAIVDPPDGLDIEGIREFREPIDTKYAALYYPYVEVRDPSLRRNVSVAPSGHMAGIYARVDVERGVHKAPANEVVRGIRRFVRDVSKREQDLLNPGNINALRAFPGRGQRVWGARVLTSDASWKYINVRRLFIFVEESIDEGTQWVVFEPNDEPLWARVRATITNFLLTVWRSGALEGTKPDEAFFVKCDRTTMTQADIDNGRLICIIGIAPVKPAEFVIFRIQQKTRDATA